MAKKGSPTKQALDIDFSGLGELTEKLDELGGNIKEAIDKAMEKATREIQKDTIAALDDAYLPARGKYSTGETKKSVYRDIRVEWSGNVGTAHLGFDKSKPGAGGFLITGTPKMQPDQQLAKIYSQKSTSKAYEKRMKKQIEQDLKDEIERRMQ